MKPLLSGLVAIAIVLSCSAMQAADKKDDARDASSVSEPHKQTLKGIVFYHRTTKATFATLAGKLQTAIPAVKKALLESHAIPAGGLLLIYHGATMDPNAEFEVQVGFPIEAKVAAPAEFQVSELPEYACISVLYTGSLAHISSAYEKLLPAAMSGPDKLSPESREMYLYFEGPESPNNVVHISAGLK